MTKKTTIAAIAVVLMVPAAIAQWPAASLRGWITDASAGRWSLASADGTIWNGSGTLLALEGAAGSKHWRTVQNLRWKIRWQDLLRGHLAYDTTLEQGKAIIDVGVRGLTVENLDAQLPATVLAGLFSGPLSRYGWTGILQARATRFNCRWNGYACSGEIEIIWRNAGISEVYETALGSYRSRIIGEGQAVHFDLATLEGSLQVSGAGDFDARGMRFSGQAEAKGADANRLEAHLRVFGRRGAAPGVYLLEYRTPGRT